MSKRNTRQNTGPAEDHGTPAPSVEHPTQGSHTVAESSQNPVEPTTDVPGPSTENNTHPAPQDPENQIANPTDYDRMLARIKELEAQLALKELAHLTPTPRTPDPTKTPEPERRPTITLTTASPEHHARPRSLMPEVKMPASKGPVFGLEQKRDVRDWLADVERYFKLVDFYDPEKQVLYAINNLVEGSLVDQLRALMRSHDNDTNFSTWDHFRAFLAKTYGSSNYALVAKDKLNSLRMQKGQAVASFIAEFDTLAVDIHYNDEAKADAFCNRLQPYIRRKITNAIFGNARPVTLQDWKTAALNAEEALNMERMVNRLGQAFDNPPKEKPTYQGRDGRDRGGPRDNRGTRNRGYDDKTRNQDKELLPNKRQSDGGDNRGTGKRRRFDYSEDEYFRRLTNNLCLNCAREGHRTSECKHAFKGESPKN